MKNFEDLGLRIPHILIPHDIDIASWSVIACDQYTQDRDYWKKAQEVCNGKASTLNLILPEVYLGDSDKKERIERIRKTMKEYLDEGVFDSEKVGFVYIERTTAFGRMRRGLVVQIDLETYEWKPFSKANIRATEATIQDRIPPRMEIRRGAPLELPHIMLLVNDKEKLLVEGAGKIVSGKEALYSGKLMNNGGSIKGLLLESDAELNCVKEALNSIAEKNTEEGGSTFLFAVGDGNHSLATAKACWDEHKALLLSKGATEADLLNSDVRYALVEIVNLYDEGLTFEPIHRVIFNIDNEALLLFLEERLGGKSREVSSREELSNLVKNSWNSFGFAFVKDGSKRYYVLETSIKELAVSRLQPEIDVFLKNADAKAEIDYIHGSDEVLSLGEKENSLGILLPPIAKDSFFETIGGNGPLPRKSFSMGEADEKRFYLECRRLFS